MQYAAFGSNLHPLRLTSRIASARLTGTSYPADWSLRFHKSGEDGPAKCNIVRGGKGVHLAVYDINARDKKTINAIERSGYSEAILSLTEVGDCFIYTARQSFIDESLLPYNWYRGSVLAGARRHGFPQAYVQRIASRRATQDQNPVLRAKCARVLIEIEDDPVS